MGESIARKKFGGGGDNRMMMFHWGETELKNQMQYRRVVDDDVVIIHKEKTDTDGHSYPAHLATTHMAAFVKHPLQPRKPPEATPRGNYGPQRSLREEVVMRKTTWSFLCQRLKSSSMLLQLGSQITFR